MRPALAMLCLEARDRNWVTSRQPDDIPAFSREMLALFAEPAARRQPVG